MKEEENKTPALIYINRCGAYCVVAEDDLRTKPVRITYKHGEFSIATTFPDDIDPTTQVVFPSLYSKEFKDFLKHYYSYRCVAGIMLIYQNGEWRDSMFTRYDIEKQIEDIRKDIPEITSLYDPTHSLHDMQQLFPDYCSGYRFSESYSALKQVVRVSRTALFSTADAEESETLSELIKAYLDMIAITAVEEFKNGLILGQKIEKLHQNSLDMEPEEFDDVEEYLDESEWEECEPDITDLEDLECRYYEGEATLDDLVATGEYEIHVKNDF